MFSPIKSRRPGPSRSNAPPRSSGPSPGDYSPSPDESDDFPPAWARAVTRFSTISGALSLASHELKSLKSVPREKIASEEPSQSSRITRTRSLIMLGQRIDFSFQTGPRYLKGKGLPVYALANASEGELTRHVAHAGEKVMEPFGLRRIRVRIQWPYPRGGEVSRMVYEEWIKVELHMSRVQLAMSVARVFRTFFEKHRVVLTTLPDYTWLLRPDGYHRVWLTGLERTENNVFEADLRYVKDYPDPQP
ncbi:hypothetical protein BN946_scf185044.g16 [Trametes cinnabarina]|uniref:Uncharacterized protein n=1 Tax=Pycnoporus cinnabarinus TaxID=5643 RepID=A0A060S6U2_PYCCI|nr:hypothetical protein BN946_scf185044.g16 [Trametes cinnabarina]